ncbi:unnamed protein product [Rotaria sp. Silwood2]|nr:unnamed protein product [Rotaria sp. Silwood2]CAF3028560.1 unnamed protein product [Rotaria sp. Silwood2]CAF3941526.1 unnamed protein product [Rotaria sp. Silwood2]
MPIDMEGLRDGYRGRYRDQHNNFPTNRNNHVDRSTRGNYRGRPSHNNNHNGNYSSRNSPNESYKYRSSRISLNSRPVSSRNGPPKYHHYQHNDDYPSSSNFSSSLSNRTNSGQSNYYDNHSPSSRFDRSSNHREIYPSLLTEQPIISNGPIPSNSLYYTSSQSISPLRDRGLHLPPSQHMDSERNRYVSSSSNYRRNSPPPPVSSYRNERSMDYGSRNTTNDTYMRNEYRSLTPPPLALVSSRSDPYGGEIYRANEYGTRSERYDIPPNRNNTSSRDYSMASVSSSTYRNDLYRSSSNVSMSSPSSYMTREQYVQDINYRPMSQSRDYGSTSSTRNNYTSSMDNQEGSFRNARDRNHNDNRSSSHRDRPNLKRSGSRYNDNEPIPSKRPMRR